MPAPKILLVGDSGTGKTYSAILSAARVPGKKIFIIFTEPGMDTIPTLPDDIRARIGKDIFWNYIGVSQNLKSLLELGKDINSKNYEALSQSPDKGKKDATEWRDILELCLNLKDKNTGKEFGHIEVLGDDWIVIFDSLSGLNDAAWRNHRGDLVTAGPQNYKVVQDTVMGFLKWVCRGLECGIVMTAHSAREADEVSGTTRIYPSTPGSKIAPLVGRDFGEVVQTVKDGDKFYWSATGRGFNSKTRNLPNIEKIPIDLTGVWKKYHELHDPGFIYPNNTTG